MVWTGAHTEEIDNPPKFRVLQVSREIGVWETMGKDFEKGKRNWGESRRLWAKRVTARRSGLKKKKKKKKKKKRKKKKGGHPRQGDPGGDSIYLLWMCGRREESARKKGGAEGGKRVKEDRVEDPWRRYRRLPLSGNLPAKTVIYTRRERERQT